jgi:hypothetical protein
MATTVSGRQPVVTAFEGIPLLPMTFNALEPLRLFHFAWGLADDLVNRRTGAADPYRNVDRIDPAAELGESFQTLKTFTTMASWQKIDDEQPALERTLSRIANAIGSTQFGDWWSDTAVSSSSETEKARWQAAIVVDNSARSAAFRSGSASPRAVGLATESARRLAAARVDERQRESDPIVPLRLFYYATTAKIDMRTMPVSKATLDALVLPDTLRSDMRVLRSILKNGSISHDALRQAADLRGVSDDRFKTARRFLGVRSEWTLRQLRGPGNDPLIASAAEISEEPPRHEFKTFTVQSGLKPLETAILILRVVLADGPVPREDLCRFAEAHNIARRTLFRAGQRVGVISERTGVGTRCRWSLPGAAELRLGDGPQ